jgi:hypothetical protein
LRTKSINNLWKATFYHQEEWVEMVTTSTAHLVSLLTHLLQVQEEYANWYELRVSGKPPERRSYHSSFAHNNR